MHWVFSGMVFFWALNMLEGCSELTRGDPYKKFVFAGAIAAAFFWAFDEMLEFLKEKKE
jgi:hypothetical protein